MNNNRNNTHVSLNLNIRGIGQSPTLAINELCKDLQRKGKEVYNMGLGQSPFPVPVTVVEALKVYAHEKAYLPPNGLRELRTAVAHFHKAKDGVDINPKNVIIGPGSKELMFILQMVYYGDIILPTPCWVSYVPQAKIIGRNTRLIHTTYENKWRITASDLENYLAAENDQFKPRLLVINYPSNPDGGTYSAEELKQLAKVARKYEMIVLSDEIYGQIHHKGLHVSIANFYPERTIISSGLSKWCGAGGWRLGTFSFPNDFEWLINPMVAVASETFTSVSSPIQYAAIRAFSGNINIERYLAHVRRILSFIGMQIFNLLKVSGIRVNPPEGAFYFFLDFVEFRENLLKRGITSSKKLCESLLNDTGVAILPGEAFERPAEELTARLSYVNFDGAQALAKSETIPLSQELPKDFGEHCLANVLKGIHKMIEWVKQ